jgi:hypothetical protein
MGNQKEHSGKKRGQDAGRAQRAQPDDHSKRVGQMGGEVRRGEQQHQESSKRQQPNQNAGRGAQQGGAGRNTGKRNRRTDFELDL